MPSLLTILTQLFLEDTSTTLIEGIQSLITSIRTTAPPPTVSARIIDIADIVGTLLRRGENMLDRCRARLLEREDDGSSAQSEAEWKEAVKGVPPVAFEIARTVRELTASVGKVRTSGQEDFR